MIHKLINIFSLTRERKMMLSSLYSEVPILHTVISGGGDFNVTIKVK